MALNYCIKMTSVFTIFQVHPTHDVVYTNMYVPCLILVLRMNTGCDKKKKIKISRTIYLHL